MKRFLDQQPGKTRTERLARCTPPRLRVRRGSDRGQVSVAIEGTLDEFAARMLACSIEQVPRAATVIVDLSAAGPVEGKALAAFARVFAGREVHLCGVSEADGRLRLP